MFQLRTGDLTGGIRIDKGIGSGDAMCAHRIEHDDNPVLEWGIGNLVGRYDARSNVYPRKARPEQKIDAGHRTHHGDRPLHGGTVGAVSTRAAA